MRILHTSDWHLGVSFHDQPRIEEQAAFLDWLVRAVVDHDVDALVVAGDVFDTENPSSEAQALYFRFLGNLAARAQEGRAGRPRKVVVVGGNHDSPARLDAPRDVLAFLETVVVGGYDAGRALDGGGDAAGALVPLRGASGAVEVVVVAVPFLHDYRLGVRGFDDPADDQRASMHEAFRAVYTRLADRAEACFPGARLVATGHLTVLECAGAMTTEADAIPAPINRVGTLGALDPSVFDPRFAYVALGHIHRGFAVDAARRVHYSGTPVQVSAVEIASQRRVLLVDVQADAVTTTSLPVPQRRRLVALSGSIEEVLAALVEHRARPDELPPYASVELRLAEARARVEQEFLEQAGALGEGAPRVVDVVARVERRGEGAVAHRELPLVEKLTEEQAFRYAWARAHGPEAEVPEAVLRRFRSVVERIVGGAS